MNEIINIIPCYLNYYNYSDNFSVITMFLNGKSIQREITLDKFYNNKLFVGMSFNFIILKTDSGYDYEIVIDEEIKDKEQELIDFYKNL